MSLLDTKIVAARAVGGLVRRVGRGGGTSLPGKLLMRLDPNAIEAVSYTHLTLPTICSV